MTDHVVVDVEILRGPDELEGGWNDTHKMGVSVACLWEERTRRMRVYGPDDVEELRKRLLRAERITGFNNFNFDFPVIWEARKRSWLECSLSLPPKEGGTELGMLRRGLHPRTNDLLRRIWIARGLDPDTFVPKTHGGYPLDQVAEATLGVGKIGNGALAPKWYAEGKVEKVVNYCADDVALTRDLAEFADRYGYVVSPSGMKIEMRR